MAYQNRTWVAGELATAALFNTYLRDPIALVKTSISDDGTTWQGALRALFAEQTTTATGTQHNLSLSVGASYLRCNNASALTITGLSVVGIAPAPGATLVIDNVGASAVTLKHQDTGSTAEHRIICPGGADVTIAAGGRMLLLYDGTTDRWRAVFGGSEFVGGIKTDLINELTSAAGVTVDGVLLKDGAVTGNLTGNITGAASVGGALTVSGDVKPNASGTRDLGLTAQRFDRIWLTGAVYEAGRTVAMGDVVTVPYNAGDFTAGGSMVWTVEAADLQSFGYSLCGDQMTIYLRIVNSQTSGTASNELNVKIPGGYTAALTTSDLCTIQNNSVEGIGTIRTAAAGTVLRIFRDGLANWTLAASGVWVIATVTIPVQV